MLLKWDVFDHWKHKTLKIPWAQAHDWWDMLIQGSKHSKTWHIEGIAFGSTWTWNMVQGILGGGNEKCIAFGSTLTWNMVQGILGGGNEKVPFTIKRGLLHCAKSFKKLIKE